MPAASARCLSAASVDIIQAVYHRSRQYAVGSMYIEVGIRQEAVHF